MEPARAKARHIDGIFAAPSVAPKKKAPAAPAVTSSEQAPNKPRAIFNHAQRHAPQRAHTLMRKAVKKPLPGVKKQLHVQQQVSHNTPQIIPVKHTIGRVDPARSQRALQSEKHTQVNRFHSPATVPVTFSAIPVAPAPHDTPQEEPPVAPAPTPGSPTTTMFENAIAHASHYVDIATQKKQFHKKTRHHHVSMGLAGTAVLLLAGCLTYLHTPGLQIKIASLRSGIATVAPDFEATGFAYDGVRSTANKLIYGLKTPIGSYQLSEQPTNLDGRDMVAHVSSIAANGLPNYTTIMAGSHTVYRLSETQATWVKNGIWYHVHGTTPLTDDQLKVLAKNS